MITIFNKKEVYNGFSMQECGRIRDCLSTNHINYSYNCVDSNNPGILGSGRSTMGSFGEDMKFSYAYYIYVHKNDYEKACYVINHK